MGWRAGWGRGVAGRVGLMGGGQGGGWGGGPQIPIEQQPLEMAARKRENAGK